MAIPADVLDAHVAAARAAWPTLVIDVAAYAAWLDENGVTDLATRDADLALAWAAGTGDREAHRLVEERYFAEIPMTIRRFGGDRAFVDEVTQRVRVKLLVAPPGELAPIARYALGGRIGGLIHVAAVREALNQRRGERPAEPVEALERLAGETDPELAQLKKRYAQAFERAFAAAALELSGPDRQLLRLHLSLKATIDDIARIYNTHRATAARRVSAARDRLAERTREHLQSALGLPDEELTSLLRLIRTEASRLLASIAPTADENDSPDA